MTGYRKLVRDGVPDKIRRNGEVPITRVLDDAEYDTALQDKLYEELEEFFAARSAGEAGDVQEVWHAILERAGIARSEADQAEAEKFQQLGGFSQRVYLEDVEEA